jgi:plasmid maintenance system antidote protein VapI
MSQDEETFESMFAKFEKSELYWNELLRLEFSRPVICRMQSEGITRRALAQRLGVTPPQITRWLNGEENMTLSTMVRITRALGLRVRINVEEKKQHG